jgi:hypothetical protein
MKTLDRYQLEGMGFNAPEGPCFANGRLLRFFILRSKPWLGVEEYLPVHSDSADEPQSEVYAVNYGKHYVKPIQNLKDLQDFLYQQY